MSFKIKKSIQSSSENFAEHPDPLILSDYVSKELNDKEALKVSEHLRSCHECRDTVLLIGSDDQKSAASVNSFFFPAGISLIRKICGQDSGRLIQAELFFAAGILCVLLSFIMASKFWQFLVLALICSIRYAVLKLEKNRFLKIERSYEAKGESVAAGNSRISDCDEAKSRAANNENDI